MLPGIFSNFFFRPKNKIFGSVQIPKKSDTFSDLVPVLKVNLDYLKIKNFIFHF
jgi:hypothetical protein